MYTISRIITLSQYNLLWLHTTPLVIHTLFFSLFQSTHIRTYIRTYATHLFPSLYLLQVISKKLGVDAAVFADLGPGVYLMRHKTKEKAKWVGLSPDLCRTLCGLFFQLYLKQHCELNPLQVELKFFSPNAADWDIQVWFRDPKDLLLERAKKIVEFKTLKPLGLNNSLKFTTKEVWEEFTIWCAAQRRQHSWVHCILLCIYLGARHEKWYHHCGCHTIVVWVWQLLPVDVSCMNLNNFIHTQQLLQVIVCVH